ncbi:hypothetical protein P9112_007933 [Eukaryota sp. TZLM1-RC]
MSETYNTQSGCSIPDAFKPLHSKLHSIDFGKYFATQFPSNFSRGYFYHIIQDAVGHHKQYPYLIPEHNRALELSADTHSVFSLDDFNYTRPGESELFQIFTAWKNFLDIYPSLPSFSFKDFVDAEHRFYDTVAAEWFGILANKHLYKNIMKIYGPCNVTSKQQAIKVYQNAHRISIESCKLWNQEWSVILKYINENLEKSLCV